MKRWVLAIVVSILVGLALVGCAQMEKGVVVSKVYTPESGYWSSMCTSFNKVNQCTFSVPVWNPTPETWEFYLRDGDDEGYRDVTREEYNAYKTGQIYP